MSESPATIAYNFYEHKEVEKLLSDGIASNVSIKLIETKETSQTYDVGGEWVAVLYTPVGKKPSVSIRPVLKA